MVKKINKKILIVEDDEDFLSILKIRFASEGFSIVTAGNGQDGASMVEQEKPDLILSDILLPKMDGIEMANKIKKSNKDAVIMFLTNLKDSDYTKKAQESGEFEYLVKSDLHIDNIVDRVKNKLKLS